MKYFSILAALVVFSVATSCNHVYREYDKESFSTFSWQDGQAISFRPKIDDVSKNYKIIIGMRHHFGLDLEKLSVNIKLISPSGKTTSKDYDLRIKDTDNKNLGSCAGDVCDLEAVVDGDFKFEEAGEYEVSITHNEKGYRVPGVLEIGFIIDEKE